MDPRNLKRKKIITKMIKCHYSGKHLPQQKKLLQQDCIFLPVEAKPSKSSKQRQYRQHEYERIRGQAYQAFEQYPIESAVPCPAEAGDVLFFNYMTIHGSGINVSNEYRTTLLVQMRDPEDPPTIKTHESRGQGMMLRGFDPLSLPRGVS